MIADNHTFSSIENRVIMLDDSSQRTDEDNSGESHFIIILRLLQRNCKRLYLHILINCYLVFNQKKIYKYFEFHRPGMNGLSSPWNGARLTFVQQPGSNVDESSFFVSFVILFLFVCFIENPTSFTERWISKGCLVWGI
jgi:hypothetical protein